MSNPIVDNFQTYTADQQYLLLDALIAAYPDTVFSYFKDKPSARVLHGRADSPAENDEDEMRDFLIEEAKIEMTQKDSGIERQLLERLNAETTVLTEADLIAHYLFLEYRKHTQEYKSEENKINARADEIESQSMPYNPVKEIMEEVQRAFPTMQEDIIKNVLHRHGEHTLPIEVNILPLKKLIPPPIQAIQEQHQRRPRAM